MSDPLSDRAFSRRKAIAAIGATGVVLAQYTTRALAQEKPAHAPINVNLTQHPTVQAMKAQSRPKEGEWVQTAGFFRPGDGGGACYHIRKPDDQTQPNNADVIPLNRGLVAVLHEGEAVNYTMFGAIGDGKNDDGVQIKRAHQYANKHRVPVVNLSGEYWIKQTNDIPIQTNVHWGNALFHIDEQYNERRHPRFAVLNDHPTQTLELDDATKAALLEKIRPGVQIIPELAAYAGQLITVEDTEDRIGIRAGNYSRRGWAREELFYVEEEGRIIGDIAWAFKNFTRITATPCNDHYLVIQGGGFYFSGNTPGDGRLGYHHNGIAIGRSRTIIRDQWMGLEKGVQDISMEPRRGFYVLNRVFDVTLENLRAMPWEKQRRERERVVPHGTYGISGSRLLNCTFRNLTAEGGWVAWGVFGTNLNKNFRFENCRLNRIDVHFHCWNLYISDCTIGFKGIAITGGGDLVIENTVRDGNQFVNFRSDYGAKWDGHIRIRNCTLRPTGRGSAAVLQHRMSNFDYKYPIGFARSVKVEDLLIDYSAAPESTAPCWMMNIVPFSRTEAGARLFFPQRITFRNIAVEGRAQGVRLINTPNPQHYDLRQNGHCDDIRLTPNCTMIFDRVHLEKLTPQTPGDPALAHLVLGADTAQPYADALALYPKLVFSDCDHIALSLGHCIASAHFERCTINTIAAPGLRGELTFDHCRFLPDVQQAPERFYTVTSTLGTRFTNCTLHAPIVNGQSNPELINRTGFLTVNGAVRHYHLNTALGNDIIAHLKNKGTTLTPAFIARLKSHHELEISAQKQ